MYKKAYYIVLIFFLQGCVSPSNKPIISNYISRQSLGIYLIQDERNNVVADYIPSEEPLSKLLQKGDIITGVNGYAVSSRLDILKETNKYSEGKTVALSIRRGKKDFEVKTKLRQIIVRKDIDAVFQQLAGGRKVNLTIIVDNISNVFIQDNKELQEWKSGIKIDILTSLENDYLRAFQYDPHFTLIDRNKVKEVLKELQFSHSGVVSHKDRQQIGEFIGATHIIFVQYSRLASLGASFKDIKSIRLIEVATDKVLASISFSKE